MTQLKFETLWRNYPRSSPCTDPATGSPPPGFKDQCAMRVGRAGTTRTGDHIDLWNGSRMTECFSWLRVHLGVSWDGRWSNFRGSPRTLFWAIP
jgi:hypothetical protein